ncbi:MAG TPA: MTH1187 family thiamine-binding protein [Nitrososphaera sp.]|nr:MTH1187 family thiamine-binding protein [Nitrososphaera sp.]
MTVHAEISIVPIAGGRDTSMSKEVAAAFDAIRKTRNLKADLTALGTQVEAKDLGSVLQAVKAAHRAAKSAGARRVISTLRIDERLDKAQTLQDKVKSVRRKLEK